MPQDEKRSLMDAAMVTVTDEQREAATTRLAMAAKSGGWPASHTAEVIQMLTLDELPRVEAALRRNGHAVARDNKFSSKT